MCYIKQLYVFYIMVTLLVIFDALDVFWQVDTKAQLYLPGHGHEQGAGVFSRTQSVAPWCTVRKQQNNVFNKSNSRIVSCCPDDLREHIQ